MTELMLAQRGRVEDIKTLVRKGYLFDLKVDGIRCAARVESRAVTLRSRSGENITDRFPEVRDALQTLFPTGTWVLDGELAVNDARGLPSWPLTHKRAAQSGRRTAWAVENLPVWFHVFDILHAEHADLRGMAYANRRHALIEELGGQEGVVRPVLHSPDGQVLWDLVCEHRLEGMVAKRPDAPYREGRSGDWLKIKRTSTVTCLVGGYDPGTGSRRSTFGNLHLFLLDDAHGLVPVGKVGSGFSDKELRRIKAALQTPPLIVEVEYLDVSPDGQLRQPVFQRVRKDIAMSDCTLNQLT